MKKEQNNIICLDQSNMPRQSYESQNIPENPNTDKASRDKLIFLQDNENDEDFLTGMIIW